MIMKLSQIQKNIIIRALNIYRERCEEHAKYAAEIGYVRFRDEFSNTVNEIDKILNAIDK